MGKPLDREDDWPPLVGGIGRPGARGFSLAILAYLLLGMAGFAFVSRTFGLADALFLSLIPAFPILVAVRLRRRWPAVGGSELFLLFLLLAISSGSYVFVVRDWFDKGMDHAHAEDMKWAEFGAALRRDPAFKNVEIKEVGRGMKGNRWVSGVVATQADMVRLEALAARSGLPGGPLDGPYRGDVSLVVEGSDRVRTD